MKEKMSEDIEATIVEKLVERRHDFATGPFNRGVMTLLGDMKKGAADLRNHVSTASNADTLAFETGFTLASSLLTFCEICGTKPDLDRLTRLYLEGE